MLQHLDKAWNRLRIIPAIAFNGDDAFITLIKREGVSAAPLSAQFTRPGLDQQAARTLHLHAVQCQRTISAAAVNDEDIRDAGDF